MDHRIILCMSKKSVYLETSVISYLTSRPSRDAVVLGHQIITRQWWDECREVFNLFTSEVVIDEAQRGHPDAAAKRIAAMENLPLLEVTEQAERFGEQLLLKKIVPEKATIDALHMGVACDNGMDYLLSWNCRHIANIHNYIAIKEMCADYHYQAPVICTPEQLLEEM